MARGDSFDESIRYSGDRKPFRRRRKHQGASWSPPSANAPKPDGLWCRACTKTHGYMSMRTSYNKSSAGWELNWLCQRTNNVIGTTKLGGQSGT